MVATPITVTETATAAEASGTTTVASTSTNAPDCSKQALIDSGFEAHFEVVACEGGFAHVAQPQTDNMGIVQWQRGKWETVHQDSEYRTGSTSGC